MKKIVSVKKRGIGASMVEVLIALTVLAFVTIAVTGMFYMSAKMEKKDQDLTEASHVAVACLEMVKQGVTDSTTFDNLVSTTYYALPDGHPNYCYDVDVEVLSTSMKYVAINIYYKNQDKVVPEPDITRPNLGRICRIGTLIRKPS